MAGPFSIEDLFVVGVAFDLLGGYMLARGLLLTPAEIAHRATWDGGAGHSTVAREIRGKIDARLGLVALVTGFVLQGAGYALVLSGTRVETGATRMVFALGLGAVFAAGAWLLARWPTRRMRVSLAKRVFREMATTSLTDEGRRKAFIVGMCQRLQIPVDSIDDSIGADEPGAAPRLS